MPPPYVTSISLTSNTTDDHRTLELIPGKTYIIGRASKNKHDMRAGPDNALFDCAVVSREHAELRSSPWQPPGRQVTLTDKRSLHGTTVNGSRLIPNSPFALKTGDVIKFGEKVARGDEAHDGISVTFHHTQLDHPHDSSYRQPESPSDIRGFHVPDDSEQSDFESEDDLYVTDTQQHSSALTTPEHSKMGAQKQSTDLEDSTEWHKRIASRLDDGAEMNLSASTQAPQSTVPESLTAESLLIPESFESDFDIDEDNDSDVEHSNGVILDEPDVASEDDELDAEMEDEEEADFDEREKELDKASLVALNDGDEYASHDQEEDDDDDDDDDNDDGNSLDNSAQKPLWGDQFYRNADAAWDSRYDPVRSSQPPHDAATKSSSAAPAAPKSSYTYPSPYSYGPSSSNLATDLSGSSRWDIQPMCASTQPAIDLDSIYQQAGLDKPWRYQTWRPEPFTQGSPVEETFAEGSPVEFPSLPSTTQTFVESGSTTTVPPRVPDSSSKGKLSIPNLLQPWVPFQDQRYEGSLLAQNAAEVLTQTSLVSAEPACAQSSTSTIKRKASETDEFQATEPAAKKIATVDAATGTQRAVGIPRHSVARRVAGVAVKYTASAAVGATVGVAATVAFLTSSYAEQLIQYLS